MQLKQLINLMFVSSLMISCSSKIVSFKTYNEGKAIVYKMKVPKGYHLLKISGTHEKEFNMVYKDSAVLFISSNAKSGSFVNREKFVKYGESISLKFLTNDSLTLEGVDSKGLYWKERKKGNIVYGYLRVSSTQRDEFEKVINELKSE